MNNISADTEKLLLADKRVVEEIRRHLWVESEKAGHDIGFDRAKEDWLKRFSSDWMRYNMPDASCSTKSSNGHADAPKALRTDATVKRRRAKSYFR